MKTINLKTIVLSLIMGIAMNAKSQDFQTLKNTIAFWAGSGSDSTALIITFNKGNFDSSFVWGVKTQGNISVKNMLDTIVKYDINFSYTETNDTLQSISYNQYTESNIEDSIYWQPMSFVFGIWYPTSINLVVNHEGVVGLVFRQISSNREPGTPIPALNPNEVSFSDWPEFRHFGEGNSQAILVVDFTPNASGKSFAFKVKFEDSTTGLGLLQKVAAEDSNFRFVGDLFLSDLFYQSDSGIGGLPNYWGTWSASNFGNWRMNGGLSDKVMDGDYYSCTYTSFAPAERPTSPLIISGPDKDPASVTNIQSNSSFTAFPNPFSNKINLDFNGTTTIQILDITGKLIKELEIDAHTVLDTNDWKPGIYVLAVTSGSQRSFAKIVKQ